MQVRLFHAENPHYGTLRADGSKHRRAIDFKLTCIFGRAGTRIKHESVSLVTAKQGLPMTSAAALRVLCGAPGAAKKVLGALDARNEHAMHADAAAALGDDGGAAVLPESEDDSDAADMMCASSAVTA